MTYSPKYSAKKTTAKGVKEGVWAGVAVWIVGVLPEAVHSWMPIDDAMAVAVIAGLLAGAWKATRNAAKHYFGLELPMVTHWAAILLLPTLALTGCVMDTQRYTDDSSAKYSRNIFALGRQVDKDVAGASLVWNPTPDEDGNPVGGGSANIGRNVEGDDTLTGFEQGVAATSGLLGLVVQQLGPAVAERIQRQPQEAEKPLRELIRSVILEEMAKRDRE